MSRVAQFVKSRTDCQFVIISLKEEFFSLADSLIGVYRDAATKSSKTLTLDLTKYSEDSTSIIAQTPLSKSLRTPVQGAAPQAEDDDVAE